MPVAGFLEACLHALVFRLSGDDELTLAGLVDGRTQPDLEGALGPFSQLAPIRTRIAPTTTFAELVDQVKRSRGEAVRWHDYASAQQLVAIPAGIGFSSYDCTSAAVSRLDATAGPLALELVLRSDGDTTACEPPTAPELSPRRTSGESPKRS